MREFFCCGTFHFSGENPPIKLLVQNLHFTSGLGILTTRLVNNFDEEMERRSKEEMDLPSIGSNGSHSTLDFAPDGTRFNPNDCWEV